MQIITESIKEELEVQLNKSIDKILTEELFQIKKITINRTGFGSKIRQVSYDEICLFTNLEELTIFNCMINTDLMNNILELKKLKTLKIYNCDFVDLPNNMFDNLQLKELTISNCFGLKNVTLNGLTYLELKNIKMDFLVKNIGILNISNINTQINISNLDNIKKIIISEEKYNDKKFNNICPDIIIVDDKMKIVEEIKNDKT